MKKNVIFIIIINIISIFYDIQSHNFDYDLIIIGAGASGLTAATLASDLGKKVLLVEKKKLGGGRIWSGDIPFKILFKKAEIIHHTQNLVQFGLNMENQVIFNTNNILKHACKSRDKIYDMVKQSVLTDKNIDVLFDSPQFIDNHRITTKNKVISGDKFIIATGARSHIPLIENLESVNYLTRENFFDYDNLPQSMIIVGGGPLGVEMASSLNRFGVDVTLIMKHGMLLPTYDYELVEELTSILLLEGVKIRCDLEAIAANEKNGITTLICKDRAGFMHSFQTESLFIAGGSTPNVDNLDLEKAGVQFNKHGIQVQHDMKTTANNIYACGDVTGFIILSRIAYYHAKIAVFNMFKKETQSNKIANYKHIAKVVFTNPLFASAGLPEQDARKIYHNNLHIYRVPYHQIEKSYIDHNLTGIAKFICDEKGRLIGAHIFGAYAGELIDTVQIGQKFDQFFLKQATKIRTSPSYFDVIQYATNECRKDLQKNTITESKPSLFAQILHKICLLFFK